MAINILLCDLTYTYQGKPLSVSLPLGISLIASYAKMKLGEKVDIQLIKYTEDLKRYLETNNPQMVCFSNFSWNMDLSHEFAKKIKENSPQTITVFGGANYPVEEEDRKKFLEHFTGIDFYIRGEGEEAFVNLFNELENYGFDLKRFKDNSIMVGNCDYRKDKGEIILGANLSRINELDETPSPYLTGILDNYLNDMLIPLVETTRGCPFGCTYCINGRDYFSKVTRLSHQRLKEELEYIAKRTKSPNIFIADSNFGMYKEDVETAKIIAEIQKKYNWPKYVDTSLGKNKETVFEAVAILKDSIIIGAPVQSTNEKVLENIKRRNISTEKIMEFARGGEEYRANSFSEIILCLPGDTKEAHFKSMSDMIDAGINVVRAHQLLTLPCSQISNRESREKYQMITRFRLQPRCFGIFKVYNKQFKSCEIDEICVANNTMSYKDYLDCRCFDLVVEIFYNNGIFQELIKLLKQRGITASSFIRDVYEKINESELKDFFKNYLKENEECLWEDKAKLEEFIKQPGVMEEYIQKELRNNEQLTYRAIGFFTKMRILHEMAFESAKKILMEKGEFDGRVEKYFGELFKFSLLRKDNLLSLEENKSEKFHFDFIKLSENVFNNNPYDYFIPEGKEIRFFHSNEQKELMKKYLEQFGTSMSSLGSILSRSRADGFYRMVE